MANAAKILLALDMIVNSSQAVVPMHRPVLMDYLKTPAPLIPCLQGVFSSQVPAPYTNPKVFSGPIIQIDRSVVEFRVYFQPVGETTRKLRIQFSAPSGWHYFMIPEEPSVSGVHANEMVPTAKLVNLAGEAVASLDLESCRNYLEN